MVAVIEEGEGERERERERQTKRFSCLSEKHGLMCIPSILRDRKRVEVAQARLVQVHTHFLKGRSADGSNLEQSTEYQGRSWILRWTDDAQVLTCARPLDIQYSLSLGKSGFLEFRYQTNKTPPHCLSCGGYSMDPLSDQ